VSLVAVSLANRIGCGGTQAAPVLGMSTPVVVRNWKSLAFRGAAGITFGLAALSWPRMTLAALVLLFGVYSLVDGVAALIIGAGIDEREYSWAFLLEGLIGLGVAMLVFGWTGIAIDVIALAIGWWAIATGGLELLVALRLRHEPAGYALLGGAGVLSIALGGSLLLWPRAGSESLVVVLGGYAFIFGAAMFLQALRLRRRLHALEHNDNFGARPRRI
jgi:uncharacterized membrane protein HdeD (DUF308 family)